MEADMIYALAGAALGWLACRSYTAAMRAAQKDEHDKEINFMAEEIKRLRAQVAKWIGTEPA